MKNIAILGSTGSIGRNTLEVARRFPNEFKVAAISVNSNTKLLLEQIDEFRPYFVCVADKTAAQRLGFKLRGLKLFIGKEGLEAMVKESLIDQVVMAISGSSALLPLLKAISAGKEIALANKEALVMAGPLVMQAARSRKIKIIPIDSEQSAIWQCLEGRPDAGLEKIYLTASGGPLIKLSRAKMRNISLEKVLRHPRWKMGRKISVDSASLMNKGLELLEAMFLFNIESQRIKVLIHPQAVIHSMVEFIDGVVLAQLSAADMRIPIQYALSYPGRMPNFSSRLNFYKLGRLDFQAPDFKRFPCLGLAYEAARKLGTAPCVLNAANEISVFEFLRGRIKFTAIADVIGKVLSRHRNKSNPDMGDIQQADSWAREEALKCLP
jgi:1-deoxy-D-xylulose-5-phosphate reductoisomerase